MRLGIIFFLITLMAYVNEYAFEFLYRRIEKLSESLVHSQQSFKNLAVSKEHFVSLISNNLSRITSYNVCYTKLLRRRTLINRLRLPRILNIAGMKPWDVKDKLMDTLQMWKFGDYKNYTSLSLLCAAFDIPTPKDDIDGSQVAEVFYKENDIDP